MDEALRRLYRELGYDGELLKAKRVTRSAVEEAKSDEFELPPLDEAYLRVVQEYLREYPAEAASQIRDQMSYPLTDDQIQETFKQASRAFENPEAVLRELQSQREVDEHIIEPQRITRGSKGAAPILPARYRQYADIKVEPGKTKFEPRKDALGWAVNTGLYWLRDKLGISYKKAPFPLHGNFTSNFQYEMRDPNGRPFATDQKITVALFSDFGTGLYHSKYLARKIAEFQPDYAFHLGDVYYAGRHKEVEKHLQEPLEPVLKTSRVFVMNANHEMYSGAFHYFNYINSKHGATGDRVAQEQEGSYFCVWNETYQIIGIDTAYHENGRHSERQLQDWLGQRLREGKTARPQRVNILLSPNHPYSLGEEKFAGLYEDLKQFVDDKLIDYWFWGNTHYGVLFDKTLRLPFIGSCLGHGGHPIYKEDVEERHDEHRRLFRQQKNVAPVLWAELTTRFPENSGIRPEIGNNGFCMMELEGGAVRLNYYDWVGSKRLTWPST